MRFVMYWLIVCILFTVFFFMNGCTTAAERAAREQAWQEKWNAMTVDEKLTYIRQQQEEAEDRAWLMYHGSRR